MMDLFKNIFNFCMIAGVIQGFVFLIYTSTSKRGGDKSIVYLNLFVLFLTLNNIQIPIIDNLFTKTNFYIDNLHITFYLLTVPAFYAFLVHFLKIEDKVSDYLTFAKLFFLTQCLVRVVFYFNYFHEKQNIIIGQYAQIEEITNAVFLLFVFYRAANIVFNKSKLYSYVLSFDKIRWLKTFLILGALVLIFWVTAIALNAKNVLNQEVLFYYPLRLSSSVLLYWIGYQGFRSYTVLSERIEIRKTIANEIPKSFTLLSDEKQTENSNLDQFIIIENHFNQTDCYMNADFSLKKLSEDLNFSESYLSKKIRQHYNFNFSDFVNSYRVEKAKEYLKAQEFDNYTIESIGLECGFNSKSTFYLSFNKFTGTTPTEFRKKG